MFKNYSYMNFIAFISSSLVCNPIILTFLKLKSYEN
ncbi:hypothetical protein HDE68_004281 [Pedobacter cryoconitis]|uniref:Uncharacterized protein n=1 Tax=Pedobacter cryoconitis TaxID=188932 RepID=A0A7W8ZQL1_9SPHI|nr:hypothetical protein [Pedobacter cryoconitis]